MEWYGRIRYGIAQLYLSLGEDRSILQPFFCLFAVGEKISKYQVFVFLVTYKDMNECISLSLADDGPRVPADSISNEHKMQGVCL